MECDRNNFSSFAGHFLPFITLLTPKIWKKCKKMEIFSFYTCTINEDHMMYGSWDIRHNRVFCHFGHFFALCPSNPEKFWKNETNAQRYYHFTLVYHKLQPYDVWFLRYGAPQNFFSFWTIFCPFNP